MDLHNQCHGMRCSHGDFRSSRQILQPAICPNTLVTATFSEAMQSSTINTTTFTLTGPGLTAVPGTVAYVGSSDVATFTPNSPLALNTLYTATITTGAQDLGGDPLASNYVWTFTTSTAACAASRAVGNGLHVWNSGRHSRPSRIAAPLSLPEMWEYGRRPRSRDSRRER